MKQRLYLEIAKNHFKEYRQMLFLMGPRQVGKTTICQELQKHYQHSIYLNWDNVKHQSMILDGGEEIAKIAKLDQIREEKSLIVFDEIHKFGGWKNFLKGFFDIYEKQAHILVTGSSRLDVYRKGADSLMGRYFILRAHPLSIREIATSTPPTEFPANQTKVEQSKVDCMLRFGGFPEPYLKGTPQFYNRWKDLRHTMLFHEDLRELSRIQELGQMELLAELLRNQIGELTTYTSLAKKIRVSVDTIRRWIEILKSFYYCFEVRPWSKNVTRSLLKEPKFYLWDSAPRRGSRLPIRKFCRLSPA